jgi:hypothetical protein
MNKRAVEQTGLIPRSIIRTFERFLKQLLPGAEMLVIQEFRISRYQVIVSVRCFLTLLLVPILVNIFSKTFLITPLVEFLWNQDSNEIFLNSYQQKRALKELYFFEDKIYFESLLTIQTTEKNNESIISIKTSSGSFISMSLDKSQNQSTLITNTEALESFINKSQDFEASVPYPSVSISKKQLFGNNEFDSLSVSKNEVISKNEVFRNRNGTDQFFWNGNNEVFRPVKARPMINLGVVGKNYQNKILEIATNFNKESIEAISNLFADFFSFFSFTLVFVLMKPQIIILKSFLAESLYSLSDTTKSFLLILGTDLLVGFHSPHGWEVFLESFLRHLGLPENVEFMSLFVATFPVFLDTVFKYWIFRSLNKISPSTVATYHNMIE